MSKIKLVRTYSAGVYFGEIESRNGREVIMRKARMVRYWDGANTLSELAVHGTAKPENCQFPVAVDKIELLEVISIYDMTDIAIKSLTSVPDWNF